MSDFIPCRSCAKKRGPKPGYFYVNLPPYNQRAAVECECHKRFVKQATFMTKAKEANIWPQALSYNPLVEYKGAKSGENLTRFMQYVNSFSSYEDALVYIYGPNGTQKTTLAQWAGAQLIMRGYSVRYILMQTLLSLLSSGFDSDEDKLEKIARLQRMDLLIIDEAFSKDKVTLYESGYQLPFLDRFLRERIEINQKGLLVISNKAPELIESQKFSRSIQDFVDRNSRASRLLFEDNYLQEANDFNPRSIFDK